MEITDESTQLSAKDWEVLAAQLLVDLDAQHPFGRAEVTVGERTLKVLVAETPEQRARGMIGRRFEGFDAMLFVFETSRPVAFHNQGVIMPILIAFYDEGGICTSVQAMQPGEIEVRSPGSCRYVLELPLLDNVELLGELVANPPLAEAVNFAAVLEAQERRQSADAVNLRAVAEPTDDETCPNCTFYVHPDVCELVDGGAKLGMVCDEFTAGCSGDKGGMPGPGSMG